MKNLLKLIGSIAVCFSAALVGNFFTIPSIPTWYATLVKPSFSPPNYLFGPVWTVLYILMGVSLYLIWSNKKNKLSKEAITLFATQLILNAMWSPVFFGAKNLLLAFVIIVFLWIYVLKTIIAFSRINRIASFLLYPYLAWISFASILNFSVWLLNK